MGRVLIIVIAAVIGAVGTWLFVPTIQPARVNPDMPASAGKADGGETENTTAPRKGVMSNEKRRARAEQLIGSRLKYITNDEVHSVSWFTEQGVQVIERAMDECYLVTEMDLYMQHAAAVSDEADIENATSDPMATARTFQPTFMQIRNCASVYRAYSALHNIKLDF